MDIKSEVDKAIKNDYSLIDKVGKPHTLSERVRLNRKQFHFITVKGRRIEIVHHRRVQDDKASM